MTKNDKIIVAAALALLDDELGNWEARLRGQKGLFKFCPLTPEERETLRHLRILRSKICVLQDEYFEDPSAEPKMDLIDWTLLTRKSCMLATKRKKDC